MNEIITRLDEIEEKAEAIIADAKTGKEQLQKQLDQEKKKIDIQYNRMEDEAVKQMKQTLEREAKEQIEKMSAANRAAILVQDEMFSQNKEQIAEEIFQRIKSKK